MHALDCHSCSNLDRSTAYAYIGERHIIPISHGSAWLAHDLYETLRNFAPGDEATLDYRGRVPAAPQVTFAMGHDNMLTATVQHGDGTVTELRRSPIDDAPYPPMITSILQEFARVSGAPGVIVIAREG